MLLKEIYHETLGNNMNDKDFQNLLRTCKRLVRLFKEFEAQFDNELEVWHLLTLEEPLMIPPVLYDEICDAMDEDHIDLFGVS